MEKELTSNGGYYLNELSGIRSIESKKEWYRLFNANIFNKPQNWSLEVFLRDYEAGVSNTGQYGLRNTRRTGATFVVDDAVVIYNYVKSLLTLNPKEGYVLNTPKGVILPHEVDEYCVSEKAPDDIIVVQGEFDGFHGRVSTVKTPMRYAFQEEEILISSRAQLISYTGYEYYRKIMDTLELVDQSWDYYDRHVVEFSIYSKPVGIFNENMIIWELRKY
jgi:hypothetical protein